MSTTTGRRALRATIVLALAIATIASVGRIAFSDGADDKPAPLTLAEGQHVADPPPFPGEHVEASPEPFTVPARAATPAGVTCPRGWSWFDNPVMHVGLCVPAGWGFTDFTSATPMTQIPSEQLTGLHLVSTRAFPWMPGDMPFDVIATRGIVDVEMMLLEPGIVATSECEPAAPRLVSGTTFLVCDQAYDALGLPALTGDVRAIKIAVPLLSTPDTAYPSADLLGARLLIIARLSPTTSLKEVDSLWKLVDSIRAS